MDHCVRVQDTPRLAGDTFQPKAAHLTGLPGVWCECGTSVPKRRATLRLMTASSAHTPVGVVGQNRNLQVRKRQCRNEQRQISVKGRAINCTNGHNHLLVLSAPLPSKLA